jgi:penicillin-binding protein 1A
MEKGLSEIKARQKQLAILRDIDPEDFEEFLENKNRPELKEGRIYQGLVTEEVKVGDGKVLKVELSPEMEGRVRLKSVKSPYRLGHFLALKYIGEETGVPLFEPDETPLLQGALVCIENRTGYVKALVGGASKEKFGFNRATQAKRQPGSAFKPIIYSAALEHMSYSPATIIVDEAVEIKIEGLDEEWQPKNSGGSFIGPISLRRALELSRNICTIKILMDINFDLAIEQARRMGIKSALGRNLSLSLGASEVSLFELTTAYTTFPNSGVLLEPVLVQRIEDRHGNVLEDNTIIPMVEESETPVPEHRPDLRRTPTGEFETEAYQYVEVEAPEDSAITSNLEGSEGFEQGPVSEPPPEPIKMADSAYDEISKNKIRAPKSGLVIDPEPRQAKPALSPQTAYIMTTLLQGVVKAGTGARVRRYLNRKDLAGKTGTTNHAEDTWFIGFNPEYTSGVWVGYDEKRPLGRREGGSRAALPVWCYFMKEALAGVPESEFPIPQDISFQRMFTFKGNSRSGPVPTYVEEPVYTPFAGETLAMSPLDPEDLLQGYLDQAPAQGQPPLYGGRPDGATESSGIRANIVQPAGQPNYRQPSQGNHWETRTTGGQSRNAPPPGIQGRNRLYGQPAYPVQPQSQPGADSWVYTRTERESPDNYQGQDQQYPQGPSSTAREFDDQPPRAPEFDDYSPSNQRPASLAPNYRGRGQ